VRTVTRSDYLDRLRRVLRHIQLHLDDDLTPDVCADVANFSRYHFHRVFSGLVGESIGAHVRRLRLERAAGELRRTDRSVIDIALGARYDAHEPFTRAFKAHFGEPPAAFRRLPEPVAFPRALCGVHYGADDVVSRFVPLHEESKMIDVRLETHPVRHLLARAHRGDHQLIGRAFDEVYTEAGKRGLLSDATSAVGIYYDDPATTPIDDLRSHAAVTVPGAVTTTADGFEILDLPGGDVAVGVHRGPYDTLPESYRWLFGEWLPSSGRQPANRPCYEIYVTDPAATAPADLVTHVCVPLV